MLLGVAEVHGVDAEADVGGVLPGHAAARDFGQFDGRPMERIDVGLVRAPVGIGALDDELPLLQETLQDDGDVESARAVLEAQGEVLEVDEYGD